MRFPFGESVILHRFKENSRNAHGQLTKVFHPDETVPRVAVAPSRSDEPSDGLAERTVSMVSLYVEPGLNVKPQDEITVRGQRFGVDGAVAGDWVSPFTGWTPGAEIRLKRVTG